MSRGPTPAATGRGERAPTAAGGCEVGPPRLSYVVPVRWAHERDLTEFTRYLTWLAERAEVIVVDGSPAELFRRHARLWGGMVRHLPPDPAYRFGNGKVNGVVTGVAVAGHPLVVIGDDDVRYDAAGLRAIRDRLATADLVRPQNYFRPLPWHARWDTARTLLNRSVAADYPGTFGIRRATFEAMGGYDGDVLFENLELIRTVRAYGGTEAVAADVYVRRVPPDVRHFLGQRVRQAYDDLASPVKLAGFLAVLPAAATALALRRWRPLALAALGTVLMAETGRRRAGGASVFPVTASLLAPGWVAERALCVWAAVGLRLTRGGVRYAGGRLRLAAHGQRWLDRRYAAGQPSPGPVSAVAGARKPTSL